jgi:uncharacterized Rmd1/YagE family protein
VCSAFNYKPSGSYISMETGSLSGQGTYDEMGALLDLEEISIFPLLSEDVTSSQPVVSLSRPQTDAGRPEGPAQTRRRTRRGQKYEPGVGSVFAISLGDWLNIERIMEDWPSDSSLHEIATDIAQFPNEESEVLLMKTKVGDLDCFIMEIGVIVCWGCTRPELGMLAGYLKKYVENIHEISSQAMYEDDFVYIPASLRGPGSGGTRLSYIRGDVIYLSTDSALERLAYAYAIAQSTKLDGYEDQVSKAIAVVKDIPEKIVKSGEVGMTSLELNQRIGELYIHRSNLNLHSDILDMPNCLWDLDVVSSVYRLCRKYQDIEKRLQILNHRLDVMKDMYEMVQSELNIKDYTRLELTVVLLIVVEVIIDVALIVIPLWAT